MEEISKLALAVSIPVWASLAAMVAFTAYFAGLAGIGVMFIIVIVVTFYWYKVLEGFASRTYRRMEPKPPEYSNSGRLDAIESKLDEIAKKVRE